MDKAEAEKAITQYFAKHKACMKATLVKSTGGKIYELYCLAKTLEWLRSTYSVNIRLRNGSTVSFKASPGNVDRSKSYFVVSKNSKWLELHTDIQVRTLGASMMTGSAGKSGYHEIDIVLIDPNVKDGHMPHHNQLVLGVECKSHAKFEKGIVKQVLGIRRELSLLHKEQETMLESLMGPRSSMTTSTRRVRARPASLYWLTYVDPKGDEYSESPGIFSIEFKNWQP